MSSPGGFEQTLPDWRELYARRTDRAAGKEEILRILGKDRISPEDLALLLSPSAESCLEEMAVRARELTLCHFGRALHIYAPLYLADYCVNRCLYCGFSASRSRPRRRLEPDEIRRQGEILADRGIRQLLLLTGEDPRRSSVSYLEEAVSLLAGRFGTIGIEVYPLDVEEYRRIIAAGADSMTVYQETYNRELYEHLHPAGPKRDYSRRLGTPERAGEAGFRQIGIGALLGLDDWRREVFLMALHGSYLQKAYPGVELSLSFPRLRPEPGGYRADYPVNDRNLVQALLACRLFLPRAGISLSTRESAELRDHLLPLGITRLSAGSSTVVGGYGQEEAPEEGQFETSDKRSIDEMRALLVSRGFQPVFQDRIGAAAGGRG